MNALGNAAGEISHGDRQLQLPTHAWAYNRQTHMKIVYIIGCTLLFSVVGCKRETPPAQSAPAQSKTISDGTSTWTLGAATMNGTNIPLSNITVRATTNLPPK